MAKALRTAALVVGAVALVATGAGIGLAAAKGISVAAGIAEVGGAVGVSVASLSTAAGALNVAAGLTAKRPDAIGGGSQTEFRADPDAGVPYAMGRTGTRGTLKLAKALTNDGYQPDRVANSGAPRDRRGALLVRWDSPRYRLQGGDQLTLSHGGGGVWRDGRRAHGGGDGDTG